MTPIKEYGEEAGKNALGFLKILDRRLAESQFIAGETFTIADITALCAIDFARVMKLKITDEQQNLQRWYQSVSSRPSAKA
jgi:glutathione S-transferase